MQNLKGLGKTHAFDRCQRYFPRYDENTFLQQVQYTEGQIITYLPQRFVKDYEEFKKAGNIMKVGFWAVDITFVSFCHKIKILKKMLGEKTWRMFTFKLAFIIFPLVFIDQVELDAINQYHKNLYRGVYKFYKRYKQNGDILDLNIHIQLEQSETALDKVLHLNEFNLVHGLVGAKALPNLKETKVV